MPNVRLNGNMLTIVMLLCLSLLISIMNIIVKKIAIIENNLLSKDDKSQLENETHQSWCVREYVRQALTNIELNWDNGIMKIINTSLVHQLPDTVDEIEANTFYYRQKIRMI